MRTVVASGRRIVFDNAGNNYDPFAGPIVSTDALADRYEVVAHLRQSAAIADLAGGLLFNVVGVNDAGEPDPDAGVAISGAFSSISTNAAGSTALPVPFELVRVSASSGAGAGVARWLHVHDTVSTGFLAGLTPAISIPIAADGGPLTVIDLRGSRFVKGIRIVSSSAPLTTTETGDCAITAWVR